MWQQAIAVALALLCQLARAQVVTVEGNAYKGLVVSISKDLQEALCDEYIEGIKVRSFVNPGFMFSEENLAEIRTKSDARFWIFTVIICDTISPVSFTYLSIYMYIYIFILFICLSNLLFLLNILKNIPEVYAKIRLGILFGEMLI